MIDRFDYAGWENIALRETKRKIKEKKHCRACPELYRAWKVRRSYACSRQRGDLRRAAADLTPMLPWRIYAYRDLNPSQFFFYCSTQAFGQFLLKNSIFKHFSVFIFYFTVLDTWRAQPLLSFFYSWRSIEFCIDFFFILARKLLFLTFNLVKCYDGCRSVCEIFTVKKSPI